jgi:uncharacterized protein Yka (UPF0111/DUF47 family)
MNDLVGRFPTVEGLPDQIDKAKAEAAQVMETTLGRLDDAFVTPLDREDIMQLITDLYDVIEGVADVARRFSLYKMTQLYPNVRSQSDILCKVATALDEVIASSGTTTDSSSEGLRGLRWNRHYAAIILSNSESEREIPFDH